MAGRVILRLRQGRLPRDPQLHRLLYSGGVWRHNCLWHADATWLPGRFVEDLRGVSRATKEAILKELCDHPGFRPAVRQALPRDRFVISHPSVEAHWPKFQAQTPGSVRISCPWGTAAHKGLAAHPGRRLPHPTAIDHCSGAIDLSISSVRNGGCTRSTSLVFRQMSSTGAA